MPTPTYSFPYPAPGDPPNGPVQLEELALAVEEEVARIDNELAGDSWQALTGGGGSGWDYDENAYRKRAGVVTVQIDTQRSGGDTSPGNVVFGTLPSGYRPSRTIFGTVMNQQNGVPHLFQVETDGTVTGIQVQADTNERIRGLINFPV